MRMIRQSATAPPLHLSTAAKRRLLEVDLTTSDPALTGNAKRSRDGEDDNFHEKEGSGHAGGRGGCRSRRRQWYGDGKAA